MGGAKGDEIPRLRCAAFGMTCGGDSVGHVRDRGNAGLGGREGAGSCSGGGRLFARTREGEGFGEGGEGDGLAGSRGHGTGRGSGLRGEAFARVAEGRRMGPRMREDTGRGRWGWEGGFGFGRGKAIREENGRGGMGDGLLDAWGHGTRAGSCSRGRDGLAGSWGRLLAGITGGEGWVGGDGGGMDGRTTGWVGAGDGAGEDGSPHARGHGGGRGCWFLCLLLAIVGLSRGRGEVKDLYMKAPCVYMLASKPRGTLYVGATSDLVQRVWQHKGNLVEGFTRQYRVHRLVWYEVHESMESARAREKALKKWYRAWKVRLVEKGNPTWLDLYEGIV